MVSSTTAALIAGIPTLLGIIATIVAWRFNPKRKLYDVLDQIYDNIEALERARDEALQKNDNDALTIAVSGLLALRKQKAEIRARLK